MRLLLVSNSTGPDGGYLDWCEAAIRDFAGPARRILFVPFAGTDERSYGDTAAIRLGAMGFEATWFDRTADTVDTVDRSDVVFVGGGNTFLLLDRLLATGLAPRIVARVRDGMPYIGTSAGSNVAGPTIKTTNDMPIVEPPTFDALGLVPFQINPHYLDPDPASTHQGETREQRLLEFQAVSNTPVVAMREGALVEVDGTSVELRGTSGGRLYREGRDPLEIGPGTRLDRLDGFPPIDPTSAGRNA